MAELGQTNDPKALVPGDPATLTTTATAWKTYGDALHNAGAGLTRIDTTEGWSGQAGDAFRAKFDGQPTKWMTAGDAFHDASAALTSYISTLTWAQGQAATAISQWNAAQSATQQASAAHTQAEQQAGHSLPFNDPGAPGRATAQQTLNAARSQLNTAGNTAAQTIGRARDQAPPKPGFWSDVGNFFEDVGAGIANVTGTVVNAVASYGNAMVDHPLATATMLSGALVTAVGAGGEIGGTALSATGIGAVLGVPADAASAGLLGTGMAMMTGGGGDLASHASGDDEVDPMRTDYSGAEDDDFEPEPGFRHSEFSQSEIEEFVNGHTGDDMPGMNRPSPAQVKEILSNAQPEKMGDGRPAEQAEQFVGTVNGDRIRVIVNYDEPWKSTAYKIGQ